MPTYLSREALEEIREELTRRTTVTRKEIAEQIGRAKDMGDLSENFEYQDAKEQQGLNEARVAELEHKLQDAVVVEVKEGADAVSLGVTFNAEVDGSSKSFTIVGSTEANPLEGKISNESPIGQAFLGHGVGDTVDVETPAGTATYKIVEIS